MTRLTEYLDSECDDYGLEYDYKWIEDCEWCEVDIKIEHSKDVVSLHFKYDEEKDDLLIELSEDSFYETREFDYTVKYFWMLISPTLFPPN